MQGTTVTAEHVRRAMSIYGPSLESIKGRTTRKKGTFIPITNNYRVTDAQTMYIDKVQSLDHILMSLLPEGSANSIRKAFLGRIGF